MPAPFVASVVPITLRDMGTLAVGTDRETVTLPISGDIFDVRMNLGTTGSGAGNTDVNVTYTAPSGGVTSSGTLWTVGAGVGRIASAATTRFLRWTAASCTRTKLEAGGTLRLDIAAVPATTASTNLTLVIHVIPAASGS